MLTFNSGTLNVDRGFTASTVGDGVTASDFRMNNNITGYPVNAVNSYSGGAIRVSTWATSIAQPIVGTTAAPATLNATNLQTTLNNLDYLTFTVTPLTGNFITLSSLTFLAGAPNNNNVRAFHVFSSVTGFEVEDRLFWNGNAPAGGNLRIRNSGEINTQTVVLTDPAFANITEGVEFRIYFHTGATNQELDFGNVNLNGTVSVIPEPSSFAMLAAFGALGFAATRRRRC